MMVSNLRGTEVPHFLTKRKKNTADKNQPDCKKIGGIIANHRVALNLRPFGRQAFIDDRGKLLADPDWISLKSLTNIENGYNLPSLPTLRLLSIALEIDFKDLVMEIEPYLEEANQ